MKADDLACIGNVDFFHHSSLYSVAGADANAGGVMEGKVIMKICQNRRTFVRDDNHSLL